MVERPSDRIPAHLPDGRFNPKYIEARRIEAEQDKPGQLFRQLQLATMIGARYETLAALLDVQLPYADALLKTHDWQLWYDRDIERIEQWIRDGQPAVDVNAWRAAGAGVK